MRKPRGKVFEDYFHRACVVDGLSVIRLPNFGSKMIGRNRSVATQIICDFIISYNNAIFLIDTKETLSNALSFSDVTGKSFHYQIREMQHFLSSESTSVNIAGFIVWFKSIDKIYYISPQLLWSLNPNDSIKALDLKDKSISHGRIEYLCLGSYESFDIKRLFTESFS